MTTKEQLTKQEILKELCHLTASGKIKSFQANGTVYDIVTVRLINHLELLEEKIQVSNKYIPILCENFNIEDIVKFVCTDIRDINILTIENKFLNLNVTFHALQQLVKRFVYIYITNQNKFEFGGQLNKLYNTYFDFCLNIIINDEISNIKKVPELISLTKELLKLSKSFSKNNTGRHKDLWNFELREKIHDKATMYFVHPFLFIVEDGFIKTVELYSSSLGMDKANKFTNNSKKFKEFIMKNIEL